MSAADAASSHEEVSAAALPRSVIAALQATVGEQVATGIVTAPRRSKTDQDGSGREIAVGSGGDAATRPVVALRRWIERARIDAGPLFRAIDRHSCMHGRLSGRAVAGIVQRRVASLGSTRGASVVTRCEHGDQQARLADDDVWVRDVGRRVGLAEYKIVDVTSPRSAAALRGYVRRGHLATTEVSRCVRL